MEFGAWARIIKRVLGPGFDSKEKNSTAYVAWRPSIIIVILLGS
jgi:hypothetical protein